jgi:hypothetical protein
VSCTAQPVPLTTKERHPSALFVVNGEAALVQAAYQRFQQEKTSTYVGERSWHRPRSRTAPSKNRDGHPTANRLSGLPQGGALALVRLQSFGGHPPPGAASNRSEVTLGAASNRSEVALPPGGPPPIV